MNVKKNVPAEESFPVIVTVVVVPLVAVLFKLNDEVTPAANVCARPEVSGVMKVVFETDTVGLEGNVIVFDPEFSTVTANVLKDP